MTKLPLQTPRVSSVHGLRPAVVRRGPMRLAGMLLLMGVVLAMPVLCQGQASAPPVSAQTAVPEQPPLQAALPLEGPTALVFHVVKADKATDFEGLFGRLQTALSGSAVAARRDQGAGWRLFKQNAPTAEGHLIYVSVIDPVVAGQEYDIARLLGEAYPDEGAALYQVLLAAHVQPTVQASNLTGVTGGASTPAAAPPPPGDSPAAEPPVDEPPVGQAPGDGHAPTPESDEDRLR